MSDGTLGLWGRAVAADREDERALGVPDASARRAEFAVLFRGVERDLRVLIRALVHDRARCDDVLQDAALDLWKKFDSYDPARPFEAWARGMALTSVRRALSQAKRDPQPVAEAAMLAVAAAQDRLSTDAGDLSALESCVSKLPPAKQSLLQLRYGRGLTLAEIAERVASSLDAVHKNLSRLRAALLSCVRKHQRRRLLRPVTEGGA